MSPATRLRAVTFIIVIGCLAAMAISFRAWVSPGTFNRTFPAVPILDWLNPPNSPWDKLTVLLVASLLLAATIWQNRGWIKWLALLSTGWLVLADQSRLQPWLYQYALMLFVLACRRPKLARDDQAVLGTLRLIIVFIYFFSGLHKLNVSFMHESVPLLLRPIRGILPANVSVELIGCMMAITESLLGALLALPRTRRLGVLLAVGMHTIILLLIGPFGIRYNMVVWPWNLAMIGLVYTLFWTGRRGTSEPARTMLNKLRQARGLIDAPQPSSFAAMFARVVVIALAVIVPFGGLLGWVDVYLSWGMYAGAPPLAAVKLSDDAAARLPAPLQSHVQQLPKTGKAIVIMDWSFADLQLAYPEERIYRRVAKELGQYAQTPEDMVLIIKHRPPRWSDVRMAEEIPVTALR